MAHIRVLLQVFDKKRTYLVIYSNYVECPNMEREFRKVVSKSTNSSYYLFTDIPGIRKSTAQRKVVQDLVREGQSRN